VEEAGKTGKLHLVTFDAVDETMEYVKKGVIDATIGQDPDAQGHDPVIRLYNYLVAKQLPQYGRLYTRAEVITKPGAGDQGPGVRHDELQGVRGQGSGTAGRTNGGVVPGP
jgi:ABC-type sugar transport system substrate-binding protein